MASDMPAHGREKATAREVLRVTVGQSQDIRLPDNVYRDRKDTPGKLICPNCHAISLQKRWFLDEPMYEQLRTQSDVTAVMCPGCERVERGIYDGHVLACGAYLAEHKQEILNLIGNEEAKARQTNPLSRIGATIDNGECLELHVTTQWLAERIGKELRKAYDGKLEIDHLQGDKFSRVRWSRG